MQIQSELTESDYSRFRRYWIFRVRKVWLIFVLCGLFMAWEIFPKDYAAHGIPVAFALVLSLLFAAILMGLVYLGTMIVMAILPNKPGSILGAHTFALTDSEFQEANEAGSVSIKFEYLRRYETAQHVFLLSRGSVGYILPMRDLQKHPEFLKLLRERTIAA